VKEHRWSGWPGAFCLDCGIDDPIEEALAVGDCIEVADDSEMGFHFEFPNVTVPPCPPTTAAAPSSAPDPEGSAPTRSSEA
jgi:hypothetical protein